MRFPKIDRIGVPRLIGSQQAALILSTLIAGASLIAQTDPGPRGGQPGAGAPLPGLSSGQTALFNDGQARFETVENVANGLGPRFNSNSCSSCHAFPAAGGSSPANNPQVQFANQHNSLPSFISATGPVREARFIKNPDGTPDGGVHSIFTISGRSDNPSGCHLDQDDYSNISNISLRIPTPTFGLGLLEAISDAVLSANLSVNSSQRASLGIGGRLNRSANDGSVTRFGWKAQNKSLHVFSGEAYNVEMGITNLVFPNERDNTPNCSPLASPNDFFNLGASGTAEFDDVTAFSAFMRFLAPPGPAAVPTDTSSVSAAQGSSLFTSVGCALCHTPTLMTGPSAFGALSNQTIHPYSDLALHHMGPGLADQISQGMAGGDEFRTAPLWGLGQRLFFLHDGRETDLLKVIADHAGVGASSTPATASGLSGGFPPSEATGVVKNFNALSVGDKQALLNFLRSL